MATPDGVGMKLAPAELDKGAKVIDYSGDFRFNSVADYAEYARRIGTRSDPRVARSAAEDRLRPGRTAPRGDHTATAPIVGNPGCFAVSCLLGLAPAVRARAHQRSSSIICDCKTGVSGAGKKPSPTFHYPRATST